MVRLGLIILLLLCVTITGVYATWTYTDSQTDIVDAFAEAKITIEGAEVTGAAGVYKIESNLVLTIDQANDAHEAKLVFASNNSDPIYLKVTFTPSKDAPKEVKENAVPSELYFGTTTDMKYTIDGDGNYSAEGTPVSILWFKNPGNGTLDNEFTWHKEADGTFTYTLDQAALEDQIKLSQTFVLDTKAEHDAFRIALTGNVVARVTDGEIN